MRVSVKLLLVILVMTVAPLSARMAPVVWNLNGVTFTDGGTASGTFTYDANTNTYSAISITTTNGSVRTGTSYTFPFTIAETSTIGAFVTINSALDQTGSPALGLNFVSPLTNAGGTVAIGTVLSEEGTCGNFDCSTIPNPLTARFVTGGSVTTNAVPTMPVWFVIASGVSMLFIGALVLRRRAQFATA